MNRSVTLFLLLLIFLVVPSPALSFTSVLADTGITVQPAGFVFDGFVGAVHRDSLIITNTSGESLTIAIGETTGSVMGARAKAPARAGAIAWQPLVEKLRTSLQGKGVSSPLASPVQTTAADASVLAYTTIIEDARGDSLFGSLDVLRIQYQKRTIPFVGAFYDFRIVTAYIPDSAVVGFLSIDIDQEFGTGSYPTPWGIGLTSRDIGSEYEILIDATGVIAESLGLGNIASGIIFNTIDTSIVGFPLPLERTHDSVYTMTLGNIPTSWFGDADQSMNLGGVFLRAGAGLNPFPDFTPDVSHGLIGTELGVSWVTEDPASFTLAAGESTVVRLRALGALAPGTYTMNVTVTPSGKSTVNVPLTLTVIDPPPPYLVLAQTAVADTLAADAIGAASLTLYNTGDGMLGYILTDPNAYGWLSLPGAGGIIDGHDSASVSILFNTAGLLPESLYEGEILLMTNDETQPTTPIGVSLYVTGSDSPSVVVRYTEGWNMLSTPVRGDTLIAATLFPRASSFAFRYRGTYFRSDTVPPMAGYWMKFLDSGFVVMEGLPRLLDSAALEEGWNMIGTLSVPLEVGAVTTNPPEIDLSSFYEYSSSGYSLADSLRPGKAYWVKASAGGTIILDGTATAARPRSEAVRQTSGRR